MPRFRDFVQTLVCPMPILPTNANTPKIPLRNAVMQSDLPTPAKDDWSARCLMDITWWTIYDTYTINPGEDVPTSLWMFSEPVSSKKGIDKTNLVLANVLPMPQCMQIQQITTTLFYREPDTVKDFLRQTVIELVLGAKTYWQTNLMSTALTAIETTIDLGADYKSKQVTYEDFMQGKTEHWGDDEIYKTILQGQYFGVNVNLGLWDGSEPLTLGVALSGPLARAVQ